MKRDDVIGMLKHLQKNAERGSVGITRDFRCSEEYREKFPCLIQKVLGEAVALLEDSRQEAQEPCDEPKHAEENGDARTAPRATIFIDDLHPLFRNRVMRVDTNSVGHFILTNVVDHQITLVPHMGDKVVVEFDGETFFKVAAPNGFDFAEL